MNPIHRNPAPYALGPHEFLITLDGVDVWRDGCGDEYLVIGEPLSAHMRWDYIYLSLPPVFGCVTQYIPEPTQQRILAYLNLIS